jgi:flagellar M-ring protein FliF
VNQLIGQPGPAGAEPAAANINKSATRNYELDRTVSHTRQPVGRLKKLSIAVLVDNLPRPDGKGGTVMKPLSEDEVKKIEALVRDAVGFDAARGDRVTVQNVGFLPAATLEDAADAPIWQQPQVQAYVRHGFGLLAILVLIFAALRPALKVLLATPPAVPVAVLGGALMHDDGPNPAASGRVMQGVGRGGNEADEEESVIDAAGPYEKKLAAARTAVGQDPKRVAQVVKSWLAEDGPG